MTNLYFNCFLVALIGWALQITFKLIGLKNKARQANIGFSTIKYFKEDWLSFLATLLTIGLALLLIDVAWPDYIVRYIKPIFVLVGYAGSDIISRLLSATNKKINNIIDLKTSISDATMGTLDTPTNILEGVKPK